MKIPLHVLARKKTTNFINKIFSNFNNNEDCNQYLDQDKIKNILIIRPNYRIGNLIFLTPLINELNNYLPEAKIDIIVGMKLAGEILEPLSNVNKIISIPRELLLKPFEMYQFIKQIRARKYDLALNIMGASSSSQLVTSLIKAKYKAAYYNEKSWTPLTHTVEYLNTHKHIGLQSLELLKLFNLDVPMTNLKLDIKITEEENKIAKQDLQAVLNNKIINERTKIIALFRNARFDKKIANEWWEEWIDELKSLENNIVIIDILSPDIPKKLNEQVLEYSNKNLRLLGAFFKQCDLYISADTGPMHLAASSGAKVLALFNQTSIGAFGALGDKNKTIDINELSAKEVAKITQGFL